MTAPSPRRTRTERPDRAQVRGSVQGVFTPTHRIDEHREERQVGPAKRNPTVAAPGAPAAQVVELRFASPTHGSAARLGGTD